MHILEDMPDPDDVLLGLCRFAPSANDFEEEWRSPVADWRRHLCRRGPSPRRGSRWPASIFEKASPRSRHNGVNGVVGEPIEVQRLPIVKQFALAKERIEQLLERAVGDGRRHVEEWLVELPKRLQDLVAAFGRPGIRPADDQRLRGREGAEERPGLAGMLHSTAATFTSSGALEREISESGEESFEPCPSGKQARQTPPSARLNAGGIRTR